MMLKNANDILTLVSLIIIILTMLRACLNAFFIGHNRNSLSNIIELLKEYDDSTDE